MKLLFLALYLGFCLGAEVQAESADHEGLCGEYLKQLDRYKNVIQMKIEKMESPAACLDDGFPSIVEVEKLVLKTRSALEGYIHYPFSIIDYAKLSKSDSCNRAMIDEKLAEIRLFEAKASKVSRACAAKYSAVASCERTAYPEMVVGRGVAKVARLRADLEIAARNQIKDTCEWIRMGDAIADETAIVRERFAAMAKNGDKAAAIRFLQPIVQLRRDSPWSMSLLGNPTLKSQQDFKIGASQFSLAETRELLSQPPPREAYGAVGIKLDPKEKLNVPRGAPTVFCSLIKTTTVVGCPEALEKNIDDMTPRKSQSLLPTTAGSEFESIFADDRYVKPLREAALKMVKDAQDPTLTQGRNLFDDLMEEFKKPESGFSREEAPDAVWKTLAALAATGPNMHVRVNFPAERDAAKIHPSAFALTVIAQMIPHLDTMSMLQDKPRPYSLPHGIQFACDSGKSYHFWLSAYLARKRKKEGFSDASSQAAAFASNVGYQMKTPTRDHGTDSRTSPFNPTENSIRLDLTLAAAGARFGTDEDMQRGLKTQDLAPAFADFIGAGGLSIPKPEDRLKSEVNKQPTELQNFADRWHKWNPSYIFDRVRE